VLQGLLLLLLLRADQRIEGQHDRSDRAPGAVASNVTGDGCDTRQGTVVSIITET
jgi:hypothetical protein